MSNQSKTTQVLNLIKEGNATSESLMEACELNKAGLASQLSYLNARGRAIAEVMPEKAEFPIKGEDGVFFMGTHEDFMNKASNKPGTGKSSVKKEMTAAQAIDMAEKRETKAATASTNARAKADANPESTIYAIVAQIRDLELQLASMKLGKISEGDYSYENITIVEATDSPVAEAVESNEDDEFDLA